MRSLLSVFDRAGERHARALLLLAAALLAQAGLVGCATRTVRHPIERGNLIEVDLVREVRGFSVVEQGHEHPAIISVPRLTNILQAIEVETDEAGEGVIRQPAFHPDILPRVATSLADAFQEAGPDEVIAVKAVRKEARLGLFHRKFLTTFLAHIDNDQLYLALRRVEWPLPSGADATKTKNVMPDPIRNRKAMSFRVVTGEPIYFAGPQDLEIDWKNEVFKTAFRLPGTSGGGKRRRQVLETSRIPQEEFEAEPGEAASLDDLTPEQLRALADLEEDRREGRITETVYQRERRQLMRKR